MKTKNYNFKNKKILVFGWARSGKSVTKLLNKLSADITVVNAGKYDNDADFQFLKKKGVNFISHDDDENVLDESFDYVVKNPGINYRHPILKKAKALQIPILTEPEIALALFNGQLLVVTGSNGKTTTSTLIFEMLKQRYLKQRKVVLAGNIGIPVCEVVEGLTDEDILILELSSFQLMGMPHVKPEVTVITNLFASHLDYHESKDNYLKAKFQATKNQTVDDVLIINQDNEASVNFAKNSHASVAYYSKANQGTNENTAYFDDQYLIINNKKVIETKEISLMGEHNKENILAASLAAKAFGATDENVANVISHFEGVKHRLQLVKDYKGIRFYNDSKATDIEATQIALKSFERPVIWLAGGLDRGDDMMLLADYLKNVRFVFSFGQTKGKITALAAHFEIPVMEVEDVSEATKEAIKIAQKDDVVLLSPAAASWDQYSSFEERGNIFIDIVTNEFN